MKAMRNALGYIQPLNVLVMVAVGFTLAAAALAFTAESTEAQTPKPAATVVKTATPTPGPFNPAGTWDTIVTLTNATVTQDFEIPDPLDSSKPPQKITKEECEKNAEKEKGKPQPGKALFVPSSPTSGTIKGEGTDADVPLPYQLNGDTLTASVSEKNARVTMQGKFSVQGDNFVFQGTMNFNFAGALIADYDVKMTRPRLNQNPPAGTPTAVPSPTRTPAPTATPTPTRRPSTATAVPAGTAGPMGTAGAAPRGTPGPAGAGGTATKPAGKDPLGKTPPGMNGVGKIPGPEGATQAVGGALIPGLVTILGGLIGGLGGGTQAPPQVPPPGTPPPGPPPVDKEARRRELEAAAEKAQKEAKEAGSAKGLAGETLAGAKKEISDLAEKAKNLAGWLWGSTKDAAKDAYEGAKEVAANPQIIKDTLTGSAQTIKGGFEKAASAVSSAANSLWDKAKEAWKDPEAAAKALASALKSGAEATIGAMGSALKGMKDFLTDPGKMWEAFKEATGISNFGNAMDPNRSLADRIGQVGVGVGKLWISIVTAGQAASALKAGGTMVLERTGLKAAGTSIMETGAAKTVGRTAAGQIERVAGGEALGARHGGKSLVSAGENIVADTRGIPKSQLDAMQEIAKKRGVEIGIRPTTADARAWLESGKAIPKPEGLYNKSLNAVDEMLGAPANRRGLIGSFEPKLPANMPSDPKLRSELMERFAERSKEWKNMQPHSSRFKVVDGVIHDAKTGKPFVSDVDLAGIFKDGKPVPEDVGRMIISEIKKKCPGVAHNDINSWYAAGPKQQGIMSKIIGSHGEGGKAIVVAGPKGVGAGFMK